MGQLGANAHGEVLEAGRVPDCYLGLLLDSAEDAEAAGVLMVVPAALLHPVVPQPDGSVLYELVTGHPDRTPGQLVFVADLTCELRAWPTDTWAKVGVDPRAAAGAVVAAWHGGHLKGLRLDGLTAEEALALQRPAMTYLPLSSVNVWTAGSPRHNGGGATQTADANRRTPSCRARHQASAVRAGVSAWYTCRPELRSRPGSAGHRGRRGRARQTVRMQT